MYIDIHIYIYEIYCPGRFNQYVSLLKGTYAMNTSLKWSKLGSRDSKKLSR